MSIAVALCVEPELTVSLGRPGEMPYLLCRVVKKKDLGSITVMYETRVVDTGSLDYEGGFNRFVSDIKSGFYEASCKMDLTATGVVKKGRLFELKISLGDEETRVSYVFCGSLPAYSQFIESSEKLQTALWALSKDEPLLYRFWK